MRARSALFDVYGDHLRTRGDRAPIAALVRLLEPVGIAAPAVRTAVSRMVGQGWLEPVDLGGGRGYRATEVAIRRLDEAAVRIYGRDPEVWDGRWHLVFVTPPAGRAARLRVRDELGFLGYAEYAPGAWVSPVRRGDPEGVVRAGGGEARSATMTDATTDPASAWDLSGLARRYDAWLAEAPALVEQHLAEHADGDEAAFAARFHLVHEWRKFLFDDPGLPSALLPESWPGREAAAVFADTAERLQPGTDRFVARCLAG